MYIPRMETSDSHPKMPSNRRFGMLFTAVFAVAATWFFWKGSPVVSGAFLGLSCVTGIAACFSPRLLAPFNKTWFLFGELLGKVVSPIVLGVIFFGIMTPVGLVCRLTGRDALHLKLHRGASHWRDRLLPSPDASSFRNQF